MVVPRSKRSKNSEVPPGRTRGGTSRLIPCPAGRWRHPEDPVALEVRWTKKEATGDVSFYLVCSSCEPATRAFLKDWSASDGYTLPEAELAGFRPKVTKERRAEMLEELGLKQVAPSPIRPGWPAPPGPPIPGPPPAYLPTPPKKHKPKK